jgi:hypothetical protein
MFESNLFFFFYSIILYVYINIYIYESVCVYICSLLYFDLIKSVSSQASRTSQVSLPSHRSLVLTYIHTCTSCTRSHTYSYSRQSTQIAIIIKNEHSCCWPESIFFIPIGRHLRYNTGVNVCNSEKGRKEGMKERIDDVKDNEIKCIWIYTIMLLFDCWHKSGNGYVSFHSILLIIIIVTVVEEWHTPEWVLTRK